MNNQRSERILLIEPDPNNVERLVPALALSLDVRMTCVSDAASGLHADLAEPHDLIIAEWNVPDIPGLDVLSQFRALGVRPIIMMADDLELDEAIEAMRLGAADVFLKPFEIRDLVASAERCLQHFRAMQQRARKYRRMKAYVRRAVRDRRDLNERMELVCRDLVGAQRQLTHRVLEFEAVNAHRAAPSP